MNVPRAWTISVKKVKYKTLSERSFAFYAPKLWNSLPVEVRMANSFYNFKTLLKTYLFRSKFGINSGLSFTLNTQYMRYIVLVLLTFIS